MEAPVNEAADIRVLLVDDHPAIRIGVRTIVNASPGMAVVAEAASGAEAEALFRSQRPDVTLVDLRLPDTSGVDLISKLRADFPDAIFIVFTTYDSDEDIYRAVKAGARGYLLKDTSGSDLVSAIRSSQGGDLPLQADLAERLAQRPVRELSSRELEVLEMMVEGRNNKEIGSCLHISDSTVKAHVANVMLKLGAADRVEAVTQAVRRGIVRL
jgi:two-component system, NarL family, response regulator